MAIVRRGGFVFQFLAVCVLLSGLEFARIARAQPPAQETKTLIYSVKGADLFHSYCTSCHGLDGKGDGPVAASLRAKVPDLTQLAKKNKGQFPDDRVRQMIIGEKVANAHGTREMPVWGPIFHQVEYDQDLGDVRIENLVKYLESIQQK